jgi:hypothetical protein
MKLINKGADWIWDDKSSGNDQAIMDLQKEYRNLGLSIWGSLGCKQCGACCYKFEIPPFNKPQYKKCEYLKCSDKAECELQKNGKPRGCKIYGCWERKFKMGTDAERLQLMRIAIDILKTKKESDLIDLIWED